MFFAGYTGRLRSAGYLAYCRDHHALFMGGWLGDRTLQADVEADDPITCRGPSRGDGRARSHDPNQDGTPPSGVISQAEGTAVVSLRLPTFGAGAGPMTPPPIGGEGCLRRVRFTGGRGGIGGWLIARLRRCI